MISDLTGKTALVTGASGALGAHVILRLLELGVFVEPLDLRVNNHTVKSTDLVFHLAGVNRSNEPEDISVANVRLANDLISTLNRSSSRPHMVIFSNSIQALSSESHYGQGKATAARVLEAWCAENNVEFKNVFLPNLIGEFGRPFHNMVSSTIVENLVTPTQELTLHDSELNLLEMQSAAEFLCAGESGTIEPDIFTSPLEIQAVAEVLFEKLNKGVLPDLSDRLYERVYGMLVEASFRSGSGIFSPSPKSDHRGTFTEIGRIEGGRWQVSNVTVTAGATRGNHFHRRLIENFTVTAGEVRVSFGKSWSANPESHSVLLTSGQSITFPIGWWHSFTNEGNVDANVSIIANRWFDPVKPDTVPFDGTSKRIQA